MEVKLKMTVSSEKNSRIKPSPNLNLELYDEVNGLCPKCYKPLIDYKNKKKTKLFEVAHIYPHSPRPHEIELLKHEFRLNNDSDHEDNLIALCRDCHKIFDNPRTIEGYREIVTIKQELQKISLQKKLWYENKIDTEINDVISALVTFSGDQSAQLSLTAMKVDEKVNGNLNFPILLKIKNYVQFYYTYIQSIFAELDRQKPNTSEVIFSQIRTYYLKLKKLGYDLNQIFKSMTDWISTLTNNKNNEVAEIMVSFFVQNCEVYS